MTEVEQPPPQNGIDLSANEDDDHNKSRPADIEQDMREMERRKRVEAIMGSKLFREELERIVDSARDGGGTSGILQQLSDIVGLPAARIGSTYKASNCLMPINDIRGVESMGYAKGEKILRCKLAATFRLLDLYGWTQGLGAQITARLKVDQEYFLVNPYGLLYHEITASSLNKVDMQGNIVEQGTTNFGVNKSHFVLHSVVHAARPDIRCAIYIGCSPVVAVSTLKAGLLPITRDACVLGEITTHAYTGLLDNDERDRLIRNLGPNSKVMLLTNHGALCCGETIEEAFYAACHIVQACETQLKLLPVGLDNLSLIPEESRKAIYEQARRPPEDLEKKFAAVGSANDTQDEHNTSDVTAKIGQPPKWRVGGAEFEALMRMLDNAGYRTGYIYRHPLIKSDPPKPKNDVELPPAVSSLGYLLEEEELFRQGIWKKGDLRKGGDRSRWLNSPNVYQKVEVLETGTPDPKKITKWVADGSPSHSTPVRIEDPLQFVPAGTNPKEFKRLQQQIKDNRRADKISAGPQSHILEGVTWDEANRIRDANVSATGDHVVLMGAASKGIIQRGFQHNATVYKAPYAKNPFDNVTDDELNEYKRTVERKKKSIHGEYTDTDFSESEALSSLPPGQQGKHGKRAGAQSEPEDMGAHQVMRIETQQAPVPSQPEVVLSDVNTQSPNSTQLNAHFKTNLNPKNSNININTQHHATSTKFINTIIKKHKLAKKYSFLYLNPSYQIEMFGLSGIVKVFMIHKIEIYPHYTYPIAAKTAKTSQTNQLEQQSAKAYSSIGSNDGIFSSAYSPALIAARIALKPTKVNGNNSDAAEALTTTWPPYRTVSHYGFNYPLPNIKTKFSLIELQRQKVIAALLSSTDILEDFEIHKANKNEKKETETTIVAKLPKITIESSAATINVDDDHEVMEKTASYVSVKEIHLEPSKLRTRRKRLLSKASGISTTTDEHDLLSEEFSVLSFGNATYPTTLSHSQHSGTEQEHENEADDSGDNYSSLTGPRHAASELLYRPFVMRSFGTFPARQTRSFERDLHHHHKPEAEQAESLQLFQQQQWEATHNVTPPTLPPLPQQSQQQQQGHELHQSIPQNISKAPQITLSVNTSKKRRHSVTASIGGINEAMNDANQNVVNSSSNNVCAAGDFINSLEIHINIAVKRDSLNEADAQKPGSTLQTTTTTTTATTSTHEQEFREKLEKLIGEEINLITAQLAAKAATAAAVANGSIPPNSGLVSLSGDESCDSGLHTATESHSSRLKTQNRQRRYAQTLALLQHELENLLNFIINANELHNRNVMCDCKTKILQISEEVRASLCNVTENTVDSIQINSNSAGCCAINSNTSDFCDDIGMGSNINSNSEHFNTSAQQTNNIECYGNSNNNNITRNVRPNPRFSQSFENKNMNH